MGVGMRIALYHNLHSGGAKRSVLEEVRRLSHRHTVELFCPSTADSAFCDIRPYVDRTRVFPYRPGREFTSPLGRLNEVVRLAGLWRMQVVARTIAAEIDGAGYDVVLVHPCMVTQAPAVLSYLHTPTVYYCHEPFRAMYESIPRRPYQSRHLGDALDHIDPVRAAHHWIIRRIDRRGVRAATEVLSNSCYTQQAVHRIYDVLAHVNHPGVDVNAFSPGREPREWSVLSIGALQPTKGFDFVIDALATVPTSRRPPLRIISNIALPGEREFLEQRAAERGVAITFELGITQRALVAAYSRAQLTVYAPIREPLGLVSLESQACGTAVVGVAEGGLTETVLRNRTGLLVEREAGQLGAAVLSLLEDPAQLEGYGRAGRTHVTENWNWEDSVKDLEFWLECAACRQGTARQSKPPAAVKPGVTV
jgi:glycosyltransferase involved in cell wall biosynthesis